MSKKMLYDNKYNHTFKIVCLKVPKGEMIVDKWFQNINK